MAGLLTAAAAFAGWSWTRPYEWRPDPLAGCTIVTAGLIRDHSYHWLDLHLDVRQDAEHDLRKPVFLETAARPRVEPADTRLDGHAEKPITNLHLRFWLEAGDLDGPLTLHLNDGSLSVRTGAGEPRLRGDLGTTFRSQHW